MVPRWRERYAPRVSGLGETAEERGLEPLLARHAASFERRFGRSSGTRRFFAPGRVNLMGAHLDYNGGPVMPMAIDHGTFIALRPRADELLNLASTLEDETFSAALGALPGAASGRWYDYPLGVALHLLRSAPSARGADVLFGGNLPIGAGLSSSASICVGTAHALSALWGLEVEPRACIEAALWGEREFVGVRCGIMDPHAVELARPGHLLWLDCKDARWEHLPFDTGEVLIGIVDSGIRRELAKGDFNRRVAECARAFELLGPRAPGATCLGDVPAAAVEAGQAELGPLLAKRARHVAGEVERTRRARSALLAGDLAEFGRCVSATHVSLRDLYEVSVPELDCLVEAALSWEGVFGARLTGAGFGGCAVVVLRRSARGGLVEHVQGAFERSFGRRPPFYFFRGDAGPREL